jgi:hypothetical protein
MTHALISGFLFATLSLLAADSQDRSLDSLLNATHFAFGGVGFAGVTSQGERDYKEILARPSAETDFERVFQAGNVQAKCYALTALYKLNHEKFLQLALPLRKSDTRVFVMRGCVMSQRPLSAVIGEIEASAYSRQK